MQVREGPEGSVPLQLVGVRPIMGYQIPQARAQGCVKITS